MTSLVLPYRTPQAVQVKDDYAQSAPVSPTSSTSDSVFSGGDARSSQSSAPSSVKGSPYTYDSLSDSNITPPPDSVEQQFSQASLNSESQLQQIIARHPRRTQVKTDPPSLQHESAKPIPALVRQCDRKQQFVEALVDTASEMIEVIWPLSRARCSLPQDGRNILDLRKFVQEVLRRSKTSHSTLQVALFYLMLLIPFVPKPDVPEHSLDANCRALRCGRRMFLAALILASKYLQDRNYTMSAWAKISGLKKEEICVNELAFLKTVQYKLHVAEWQYKNWTEIVFKYSVDDECRMARTMNNGRCDKWRAIIPHLTDDFVASAGSDKLASVATTPSTTPSPVPAPSGRFNLPTPPSSPERLAVDHSDTSVSAVSNTPLPQFLEPKVKTSVENIRFPMSPKPSKLQTPCLPPMGIDCTPAVSGSRMRNSNLLKCPSMGMAMKQAHNISGSRPCADAMVYNPCRRVKAPLCRRSALSQCSSSSGDMDYQYESDASSQNRAVGESYLRATSTVAAVNPATSDSDEDAARILAGMKPKPMPRFATYENGLTAFPTRKVMRNMYNDALHESGEDVRTPKAEDRKHRPLAKTASKRKTRTASIDLQWQTGGSYVHSPETMAQYSPEPASMAASCMTKHRNGTMVDYGAGIEDVARSRSTHIRSASGSRAGARKKARVNVDELLAHNNFLYTSGS